MDCLRDRVIFFPVNTKSDRNAFIFSQRYLGNPLRPLTDRHLKHLWDKTLMTDSGGLQALTKGIYEGKTVLIGPMYKTEINDPEFLCIGLHCNCLEFRRTKSDIGFCVDVPCGPGDSDSTYRKRLSQSIRAKDQFLRMAKYICPKTELGIVLQPRTPLEIEDYFSKISTAEVDLYAYPCPNGAKDALGNAYVLSFLNHQGVSRVHFMGSSAVPVIILLAKAVILDLFDRCSFDSRTWNQVSVGQGFRYLCPLTLNSLPKEAPLLPDMNLRQELEKYHIQFSAFQKAYDPPIWMYPGEWLGIWNIHAIECFKDKALRQISNGLAYTLFSPGAAKKRREQVIAALNLLNESEERGHQFVKDKYLPKLLKIYGE
jgi:hypothetical protein